MTKQHLLIEKQQKENIKDAYYKQMEKNKKDKNALKENLLDQLVTPI